MTSTETDTQAKTPFTPNPERVHEGARQILESDVRTATEHLITVASFTDLITWDAILTFWHNESSKGLLRAITKVADAPEGNEASSADNEATAAAEVPDWVTETPDESSYNLTMYDEYGASIQQIELSRDEYESLKQHLAIHRGHVQ